MSLPPYESKVTSFTILDLYYYRDASNQIDVIGLVVFQNTFKFQNKEQPTHDDGQKWSENKVILK